jgi:hypothetical protein
MFITITHSYLAWHYLRAWREIWHVSRNLLWFVYNFFSLPQLARSLFSPWRRITEDRTGGFNFESIAGYLIINLISRLIGCLLRSIVIIIGSLTYLLLCLGIFCLFIFWALAPVSILVFLALGLTFLI